MTTKATFAVPGWGPILGLLLGSLYHGAPCLSHGGEPSGAAPPLVERLSPEEETLVRQMRADESRISIRRANVFHLHFIDTCMEVMPRETTLSYCGLLATDTGRHPMRVYGNVLQIGRPLHWGVGREGLGVFDVWVSTQRTSQTLAKCVIEGQTLFVNVDFVVRNDSVDAKLPELGGRSVREVLAQIERPGPKPGLPENFKPHPPNPQKSPK